MIAKPNGKEKASPTRKAQPYRNDVISEQTRPKDLEQFRLLAEFLPIGITIMDKDENIIYVNPKFSAWFGFTLGDIPTARAWLEKAYPDDRARKEALALWARDRDKAKVGEFRRGMLDVTCKDGSKKAVSYRFVVTPMGERFTLYENITEGARIQEVLRGSETRLREIIEHSSDLMYSHTTNHVLTYMSPQTRDYLDCEPEEALVRWTEFMTDNPVNQEGFLHTQKAINTGERQPPYELELVGKKGRRIWVEVRESPVVRNGKTTAIVGALSDVTARKKSEEALRASEEKYRTILENIEEGYFEVDLAGRFTFFNNSLCKIMGYPKDEMFGFHYKQYTVPETAEKMYQVFNDVFRTGKPANLTDYEVVRKDGTAITVSLSTSLVLDSHGQPTGFRGLVRDVSDRKLAEEALRENEQRYRQLFDHAPTGIYEVDFSKGKFVSVNDVMCGYTGYSREELLSLGPTDILTEESLKLFLERMRKMFSGEKVPETVEYKIRTKDHRERWVLLKSQFLYDNGLPKGAAVVVHDITERKLSEEALRQSEEKYRLLVDNANDAIFIAQEGSIKFPNPKTMETLGYGADELAKIPYMDLVHPDDREIISRQGLKNGASGGSTYSLRILNRAGHQLWAQISSVPIEWEGRPATLNFVRDITVQRVAEERLRQTVSRLRKITGATIQAIAQTVEVRDPYTAGHQRRVSDLARAIASQMGLSTDQIDGIRLAGVIHDIGKISVPAEILSKPGLLTSLEFALIKTHSQVGYDILKDIEFPWDIATVVLQHHERMDGSGYPQGLSGETILLESRILAVADVVEAMASHRPYRPSLGIEKALEEITVKRGQVYDARVVDACLQLFAEKKFEFV